MKNSITLLIFRCTTPRFSFAPVDSSTAGRERGFVGRFRFSVFFFNPSIIISRAYHSFHACVDNNNHRYINTLNYTRYRRVPGAEAAAAFVKSAIQTGYAACIAIPVRVGGGTMRGEGGFTRAV